MKTIETLLWNGWKIEVNSIFGLLLLQQAVWFFFAATQEPQVQITELHSIIKMVSFLLMFFSILTNMICILSIPTWKYHVKTGQITQGTIMRLELGISTWISVLSFILGMLGAIIFLIIPV
ncbi:membrane protein [Beggiatoa sp. PS]|nr:membrane protein [Beggiatoa sp. PS]